MTSMAPAAFRHLCGRFATGVVVVTTLDGEGGPVGMTANSFTSVSLDPPLVSVNIDHRAELHEMLVQADRFALNVLAGWQEPLSRRFAEPSIDRFLGVPHQISAAGSPLLEGVLATLECKRHSAFEAGDHTILIGRVEGGTSGAGRGGRPLIFYEGGYHDGGLT